MIETRGLSKRYGQIAAIEDLSFAVASGEIVGLLGPNGAGKSTTMRILTGFAPPTSGEAIVAGHDVARDPLALRASVGYLPENVPIYEEMRVDKFLRYAAAAKGLSRSERRAGVGRVIEQCGLESVSTRVIRHVSRGYRQRVGLAQALLGDPPVLVLDEPTVGLDPKQVTGIRDLIRGLAGKHTVLLSTHILPEVAALCDRAIILNAGRIVSEATLGDADRDARKLERLFLEAIGGSPTEAIA